MNSELIAIYETEDIVTSELLTFLRETELTNAYSEVVKLCELVLTIPATSAFLRNSTEQDRPSSVSLLSIENNLVKTISQHPRFYNEVIDEFAKSDRQLRITSYITNSNMSKNAPPPYDGEIPPQQQGPGQYPAGPPPPQRFEPPPHEQSTVIMTSTVAPVFVGPEPLRTSCPHCHANIETTVETKANTRTHYFALMLCLLGCWPCCLIPYCKDSCQSQKHYCPQCRAYLGTYSD